MSGYIKNLVINQKQKNFPRGSIVKNPPANVTNAGSISGSGRSLEEGNGNPLQHSCLGSPMGRGAWQATDCGRESWAWLSN